MSHARRPFPTPLSPLIIIPTSLLLGVWLAFLPNLGVFCLHRRALLAIGLVSACGLATSLSIIVRCNTAIKPESVHSALVACSVKYVHLLAITLNIAIRCNTTIRLESVRCTLMTHGQVFFCYSATTLGIVIHCDAAIRLKYVCCMLAVIRHLPICRAHFK